MDQLDQNAPEFQELVQEINRRFRSKKTLYKYLVTKSVSALSASDQVLCSASFCPRRTTAPSTSCSNC